VLTIWVPGGPDLLWRTPPLSGELIRCQSDHSDYACPRGGVAMSSGDGNIRTHKTPISYTNISSDYIK
jgi:hypothetical protein